MNQFGILFLMLSGLLITQVPVSRPSSVVLTGGVNRSWTAPPPLVQVLDGPGSDPVVRMRAGTEAIVPVRERFALQFGAAYSQAGEISRYLEVFGLGPLIEDRWELDYLELSVLGRMRIPDESKRVGLHVLAGPAVALPIACSTGRKAEERFGDCAPRSPRLNVLLSGGAGVDVRLTESLGATMGFLYGLSVRGYRPGGDHLRVLSLRAGLVYGIP